MQYVERKLVVDIGGFNFAYEWHDITDKGFTLAMPWKLKVRQLFFNTGIPKRLFRIFR
jgi:hypothetical protein